MLCKKCGAVNPTEARFCGKCGLALSAPTAKPEFAPEKSAVAAAPLKKWWLIFSIAAGALLVVVILVVVLVVSSNESRPTPDYGSSAPPAQNYPVPAAAPAVGSDAYYREKVVGTWRARRFLMGAYFDLNCVYLPGGRVSWSGTVTYLGQQNYLMLRGVWEVENGYLRTRIDFSSMPQTIPVGMTGASKFVSIDNQQWTCVDLSDGKTETAVRIE